MASKKKMNFSLIDVLFPFLLPIKGAAWIGEKLREVAEAELTDRSRVQEQLLKLQMDFEMDKISKDEYEKKEAELLERLEAIRKYEDEKT